MPIPQFDWNVFYGFMLELQVVSEYLINSFLRQFCAALLFASLFLLWGVSLPFGFDWSFCI